MAQTRTASRPRSGTPSSSTRIARYVVAIAVLVTGLYAGGREYMQSGSSVAIAVLVGGVVLAVWFWPTTGRR